MRTLRKAVVIGLLALPVLTGLGSGALHAQAAGIPEGARGLGYLFRPGQAPTRNLWLRGQHPEQWQSTAREREAAKAAFSFILAVVVAAGAVTWGAGKLQRSRPSRTGARSISGERARVSLAGGR